MRARSIGPVVAAAAALALAAPARAQAPAHKPTAKELEQAKQHFKDAEAAKAHGDFKTAAVDYLAAYELFGDPEFFFDIAEVDRLAGADADALTYYEKYLELDPNGRGAGAARTAADGLRRSIAAKQDADAAAKQAADKAAADKAAAAKQAEQGGAGKPGPQPLPPTTPGATPPETPPSSPSDAGTSAGAGRGLRIGGIVTGAVGVVAIGFGIGFGMHAKSISDELSSADTFDQSRYDAGKAANRDMYIFTGVGAAALVGGGVLYYLGRRAGESAPSVSFAPVVTPSQVTFAAVGRF